jgi:hypothetical protein
MGSPIRHQPWRYADPMRELDRPMVVL